jgi:hypothetical protein
MISEQMLTLLIGTVIGVAAVLYAVRSRLFGASRSIVTGGSPVETFTVPSITTSVSQTDAAPIPKVTATPPPVAEFKPLSFAEAVSEGSAASGFASVGSPTALSAVPLVTVGSEPGRGARAQRASRRSAGAPRAHKPRTAGQTARTTKAPDEPSL